MLPDLDVLIRSQNDPLLFFEYHRQFSHSLIFIPFGGLLAALAIWLLLKRRPPFAALYAAATVGYATHGLLDACTTYGTVLLWPFSYRRFSWDLISIVDPIFTLILLIGLLPAWKRFRPTAARCGLFLACGYLGLGWMQHQRILEFQGRVAAARGQVIERARAYPSFGNLLVWRSFYVNGDRIHVDGLRRGLNGAEKLYPGNSVPRFDLAALSPQPPSGSPLAEDLKTYAWFTEGFLGRLSENPWTLGDMRFSILPNGIEPFWGIAFSPDEPDRHVRRLRFPRSRFVKLGTFWEMIQGK
jgi:inner membrane protein